MQNTNASTGVELIAQERQRQIEQEGWSLEHDQEHDDDSLARAAAIYATPTERRRMVWRNSADPGMAPGRGDYSWREPEGWPWEREAYKPTPDDRIRELVKAGALIAAEIDRLRAQNAPEIDPERVHVGEQFLYDNGDISVYIRVLSEPGASGLQGYAWWGDNEDESSATVVLTRSSKLAIWRNGCGSQFTQHLEEPRLLRLLEARLLEGLIAALGWEPDERVSWGADTLANHWALTIGSPPAIVGHPFTRGRQGPGGCWIVENDHGWHRVTFGIVNGPCEGLALTDRVGALDAALASVCAAEEPEVAGA